MVSKSKVLLQKYELGRFLGEGNFAKVYHAKNLKTGQNVAVKVMDKEKILNVGLIGQIKREISVMKMVKHPNVLQLYEVLASKTKIYFVLEYAKGGELLNKILKGRLKENAARKYFQQLISAVDFCHSRGVYHRDLKLENLLVDENGVLKVSDFGLSALADAKRQDGLLHTSCGTPAYIAPEVLYGRGYDGAKADIWSCGVILYVLLAGYLPFYDANLVVMYGKIRKAEYEFPRWFRPEVCMLLSTILDADPCNRPSIANIVESPWLRRLDLQVDDACFCPYGNNGAPAEENKPTILNAFDIISLSEGLDLSGLFSENELKNETRFTSMHSASEIISKLEDIARLERLKVIKNDGRVLRLEGKKGRKGSFFIDAEIYEITPSAYLVELRSSDGDTLEYRHILEEAIKPALKDIVHSWK